MLTVQWPPALINGRMQTVYGDDATKVTVMQVLSDLQTNPFNDDDTSLGDVTFKPDSGSTRARIQRALQRLRQLIHVEALTEERVDVGEVVFKVDYIDLETKAKGSVKING